ncbi:hypothetical protein [Carnobacterium inhibens]|uniref:Uncharacterized protein n=1 Tax=Carnobacterium inhibens subsp. gilichinskyi TaxID=1266845 RepID=U5SCT5_9LACT|nr:hypothetical protein [Carnobacterium inhibens]AGY83050.1 hypothetical protein Q783_12160 [Carnobacterium inhibens subsp. gilichinskyi]
MKKIINKGIIIFSSVLLLAPTLQTHAYAETVSPEEAFSEELAEENLELVDSELAIDESGEELYILTVETETGDSIDLKLNMDSNDITVEALSDVTGEIENYSISLPEDAEITGEDTYTEELEDITVENEITGDVYEYEDLEGEFSGALAIPSAIPIVWSALVSLYNSGLAIVAAGATFIVAGHAISKIMNNKNKKNHYLATIVKGKLYIGKGVSDSAAVTQLRSGKSTWSISSNQAKNIASKLAKGSPIKEVDKDTKGNPKKGYYWHWHSSTRNPKGHHAFYGYPV